MSKILTTSLLALGTILVGGFIVGLIYVKAANWSQENADTFFLFGICVLLPIGVGALAVSVPELRRGGTEESDGTGSTSA